MCVNVSHLGLVDPQEHREMHQRTNKRPNRLSREAVDDIRDSPETLQVVADRYGISKSYAAKVRRGLAPEEFLLATPRPAWDRGRPKPPRQRTRLSDEDIAYIRSSTATQRVLAEMFGLSQGYISVIKRKP
jgi:DNA-binding transcriptional regulator YiaG